MDAGYEFTLFDGLSRFYVAQEHSEELRSSLDYPACVLDDFVDLLGDDQRSARIRELTRRLELATGTLEAESYEWRTRALVTWATGVVQAPELAAQGRRNRADGAGRGGAVSREHSTDRPRQGSAAQAARVDRDRVRPRRGDVKDRTARPGQGGSHPDEARAVIPEVLPADVLAALAQRLEVAAVELGWSGEDLPQAPDERAAVLLAGLPAHLDPRPGPELWLYLVAALGSTSSRAGGGGGRPGPGAGRSRGADAAHAGAGPPNRAERAGGPTTWNS